MRIVCVGDCGIDRYVPLGIDRPGGITLNVAVHLRRCLPSAHITVISAVGDDAGAPLVMDVLARAGLEARVRVCEGATPVQLIDLESSGEKRFIGYDAGVLRALRLGPEERALVAVSDLLVTTVFAQVEGLFDSVMAVPSAGLRAVDFTDLSDLGDGVALVSEYVDRFHVGFFGLGAGQTDLIAALEGIARRHSRLFIVTLGPDGSVVLGRAERIARPAVPVPRVVDATGAGDSFAAGFLAEYCVSRDVGRALARGSVEAARTIQHVGAFELTPGRMD